MPANLPPNAQTKKDNYIAILLARYPPGTVSFKISAGYPKISSAKADFTPVTTVYTIDDSIPVNGAAIFTDIGKTNLYDGGGLWFHFFNSGGGSLNFVATVTSVGRVENKTNI